MKFHWGAQRLAFKYVNWKGELHEYVIQPESLEFTDAGTVAKVDPRPGMQFRWVLHGQLITRDGDPRPEMSTRRRSFDLSSIQVGA